MLTAYSYSDGYGRWHTLVRDTPNALTRAITSLVDDVSQWDSRSRHEIQAYVKSNIVSLPLSEWDDSPAFGTPVPPGAWLHFAEYRID